MTTAVLPADRPREDARRTGPCATAAGAGLPQGVVRAGLVVLGAQAVGLCAWSTFLWSRFALTRDAGSYLHVAYVISGGHLDGTALAQCTRGAKGCSESLIHPRASLSP